MSAAVSRQGREVILNSVATASKVAQALNTPEMKFATTQVFETLQSLIDFFASETGRKVIATAGECLNQVCEVAASPESSIFLAEIATNICHAMDVEAQRKEDAAAAASEEKERDSEFMELEDKNGSPPPFSPTSSAADTGFETESNASEAHYNRDDDHYQHRRGSTTTATTSFTPLAQYYQASQRKKKHIEKRASRSARIEKDVLLKMGVDPAMIGEIQRVLDTLVAEEETALMAREDAAGIVGSSDDEMLFTDDEDGEDAPITQAFGLRSSSPPPSEVRDAQFDAEEQKAAEERDPNEVILPEWHEEPLRQALRRRHTRDADRIAQRNTYATQAQEIAHVLAQRKVEHGDLSPADVFACRAISLVLTYGLLFILIMVVYSIISKLLRS